MYKSRLFTVLAIIIIGVFAINFSEVQATPGSGAIWTTNEDCGEDNQNINHYAKGDWVYINGANFDAGEYAWFIEGKPGNASDDPNIIVAQGSYEVDESGSFCFPAYQINFDDGGEYSANFDGKNDNYRVARDAASVSFDIASCILDSRLISSRLVSVVITGATLTIDGNTYTSSTTISLEPGSYPFSWQALPGYTGSGEGTLVVVSCDEPLLPASVQIEIGLCVVGENRLSLIDISLTIVGATLTIDGTDYTTSQVISLSPGFYEYSWTAIQGYTGSGEGEITINECNQQGVSSVILELGDCTPDNLGGSYRPLTLTITNASLTIDGVTYTESTTINLVPGSYPYSWTGLDDTYEEGVLEVVKSVSCSPQADPTPTPTSSPTTGSPDSPILFAAIGLSALLVSGVSLVLWRKKLV